MQIRGLVEHGRLARIPVRGHRIGNGFIKASVERAELVGGYGHSLTHSEVSHRLTNISVVVNHLIDRVAQPQKLCSMQ